jgi:hypothetical protein
VKTSSRKLPTGQVVQTVFVQLKDGTVVARTADELVKRPTPPSGGA